MTKNIVISSDPVADMLTRIRNAIAVNSASVTMPHSNLKEQVARILADNGFIEKVEANEDNGRKALIITINGEDEPAKITEISRLSRPGRRLYVKSPALPTVKRGRGLVVV